MQIKASAPGSMMLLGEFAVLHGKPALVCAVNKRISVTLTARPDTEIRIHSSLHGHYAAQLQDVYIEKPFHFVLGAIRHYRRYLKRGFDLQIETEFSDRVGLGSSAAVTAAVLAVLSAWLDMRITPLELVRRGRSVIRRIQGTGSGADIAASVYGGMIAYHPQPLKIEKFSVTHPVTALYAGFKTPTVEVIQRVHTHFSAFPRLYRHLCQGIGRCAAEGVRLVRREDWTGLGMLMNTQQGFMDALGVNTPLLHDMITELRGQEGIAGAKISGSGLGDCVIGWGELPDSYLYSGSAQYPGVRRIPVSMTPQGLYCEKI
ncbi:Galactokinase [Aquicella siphonis]|uniref:Galactokinase n=1 Tax=Aquicella siphonis TaxID=254247 RepID=A0A5E4PI05_9COXI|nr:hypothetical protein [Aquicella siphonis]VVC76544.1 Galactokinase [Aquicella siphonis]